VGGDVCLLLQVYDATSFLKEHPGGRDSILLVAGTDATEEFDAIHSEKAKKQLLSFAIGCLAATKAGVICCSHGIAIS
jgi:nitrate reductase (NAD(P)H)